MKKGAGYYYLIRSRLKEQLSRHHWTLGKSFTRNQEDAWELLTEFETVISVMGKVERFLPQDERYELTASVRRILLLHRPADPFVRVEPEGSIGIGKPPIRDEIN
jgi:hypothetical protein